MTIQDRAMLVELTIHHWSATKNDKAVSAQVDAIHAAKNAGKYTKQLISKEHLAELQAVASEIRGYHNSRTLAWSDKGQRILPSELFMDYRQAISDLRAKHIGARAAFIQKYPQLVQDARVRLGTMYDPADYPAPETLVLAFGIDVDFFPIPNSDDFRVAISSDVQAQLKAQITDTVNERMNKAVHECWVRAEAVLTRIVEQCGKKNGRIHDSLMTNAQDLVDVLRGLNITDDPDITALEHCMRELIVSPDAIRANDITRKRVADGASDILSRMQAFGVT